MRTNNIKTNNIDGGSAFLEQQPSSCNSPDARHKGCSSEDLYREGHNCRGFPNHPIEQACDGEDAKRPKYHGSFSRRITSSRKHRTYHSESSKLHLLRTWKTPQESSLAPPSPDFRWTQDSFFSLYYRSVFTGIQIRPLEWGTYLITLGDNSFTEAPTLRQSLSMCHTIAWVFRDSLPVPNTYVNPNTKEPAAIIT